MDAFPAFFPLEGRTVIIVGSGDAAEAKVRLFEGSPAKVVRIDGLEALGSAAYVGATLAFITGDELFCETARRAAKGAGVLVNVVDRPILCDFNTPAVIDRGAVVAAVGTAGAAPMLAALLRHDIEARVPEGAGKVAALLRKMQDEVRWAFPDLGQRRAFLRRVLTGPAAQAAVDGDAERAETLLREALEAGADAEPGRLFILSGRGAADLVTLRGARALAEAETIIADADANPSILAMARRDAERIAPDAISPEDLAKIAAERQVVRVITAPLSAATLLALKSAGVAIDVLAVAPS